MSRAGASGPGAAACADLRTESFGKFLVERRTRAPGAAAGSTDSARGARISHLNLHPIFYNLLCGCKNHLQKILLFIHISIHLCI